MVRFGETGYFGGFDDAIEISGTIKKDSEILYEFEGYGDYERSWGVNPWAGFKETWTCVNTAEFYGIFLLTHSTKTGKVCANTARIGFPKTNETYKVDNFSVEDIDLPQVLRIQGNFKNGGFDFKIDAYNIYEGHKLIQRRPYGILEGEAKKGNETIKLNGYG